MQTRTETGRLLHEDHRSAIDVLTRAEAFLARTAEDRTVSPLLPETRVLIVDLRRLVEIEIDLHFDFEERILFPVLEQRGAHDLTALLAAEHAGMRPLARALQRLCTAVLQDGFDDESWATFRGLAQALAERMVFHLEHEETALLEAVDVTLDPALAPGLDRALASIHPAAKLNVTESPAAG